MKIAVVGGRGFIGKELVQYAAEREHITFVIGRELDPFDDADSRRITDILMESECMVFLAARRPEREFTMEDYQYNISLAARYFELACKAEIRNIVAASSRSVYSDKSLPWKEDTFHPPLSLYGASKQAMDGLALLYNQKEGMNIKCLRLAQVIGNGERKGYLLNTLIDNATAERKQTIWGTGSGKRQYIYVRDVCDAFLHSLQYGADFGGVFNIGLKNNISVLSLAELINDVYKNCAGIEIKTDLPEDKNEYLMDVSKAERELQWKPKYELRAAFEDMKLRCSDP